MQIFISWSGDQSKALAECLRDWLPLVIQSAEPWFSPEDIDKGSRWLSELSTQLERQSVAIVCITPESLNSPWLLFEAGALSKALDASAVCPILIGIEPTEVQGPLSQFQATRATKEELRRLLGTINKRVPSPLADKQIDTLHDLLWPDLDQKLKVISGIAPKSKDAHRTSVDVLNEVLSRVRSLERQFSEFRTETIIPNSSRLRVAFDQAIKDREELENTHLVLRSQLNQATSQLVSIEAAIAGIPSDQPEESDKLKRQKIVLIEQASNLQANITRLRSLIEQSRSATY